MGISVRATGPAIAVALLLGCWAVPPAAAVDTEPPKVVVRVDTDSLRMPSTLRPGWYRFVVRVRGASSDGVQLVRPRAGYSVSEFADDLDAAVGSGRAAKRAAKRLKDNARMWGGTEVEGGTTGVFWQKLPRGRLFVTSGNTADTPRVVTVSGARRPSMPPVAASVATVADGSLTLSGSSLPASGVLKVRNRGTRDHRVGIAKLATGRTAADVMAFFEMYLAMVTGEPATGDAEAASPFDESVFGAVTQLLRPGGSQYLRYALPAGDYVALCPFSPSGSMDLDVMDGELAAATLG